MLGEPALAFECYAEAFARRARLSKNEERYGQVTREMALGLLRLAAIFALEEDIESALKTSELSVSILRMRVALEADDEQRALDLARALLAAADVLAEARLFLWAQTYRLEAYALASRLIPSMRFRK